MNRVNLSNFNATIRIFSVKFDHQFLHVFIFDNMFPESHSFVAVPVTRSNYFVCIYVGQIVSYKSFYISYSRYIKLNVHVLIFGNMFPESRGFIAMPVTGCIEDTTGNEIVRPCRRIVI